MKNCKEIDLKIEYYPCFQDGNSFAGGAKDYSTYQKSIRCDISVDITDTETTFYIFGTEKGLYSFGKYLIAESSWKCWYDHYHSHYDDICNRNGVPFINLIVCKVQGTYVVKNEKYLLKTNTKKLKLHYYDDYTDEKGVFHYGKVCAPKFTDEIAVSIYAEESYDEDFDEFFKNGKFQINLLASDRAYRELGKYLINISMFKTKNKRYMGIIRNITSNDDKKINICVSKIWRTKDEIQTR